MYRVEAPFLGAANSTRLYSPVTLNSEWPALSRLIFIVICSCIGTTLNGFFVAAFFVEESLQRIGNVFHASVGLADIILTGGVLPVSAVVILSGQWDNIIVCKSLQFLTEASVYAYNMFFNLVAAESYYRLCYKSAEYEAFKSMRIGLVTTLVFIVCFAVAALGTYFQIDYDYCQRLHYGNISFRYATSLIFHVVPFIVTSYYLIATYFQIRGRARAQLHYRRSQQYDLDFSVLNLNITAYILYILAWTPYLIIIHQAPNTSDSKYYQSVWLGVSRSLITSFLYFSMNRSFRRAFVRLFYYCCCKITLTGSFNSRHRRTLENRRMVREVRVHIMHQVITTPQRGASSSRETQDL